MSESETRTYRKDDQSEEDQVKLQTPANSCAVTVESIPPELLELIFKRVESPDDLLSCWNTSAAWSNALRSTDFYFKMALPFVLPFLSRNDLLNLSVVSKCWNATVDACIQSAHDVNIMFHVNNRNLAAFINKFTLPINREMQFASNPVPFRQFSFGLEFNAYDFELEPNEEVEEVVDPMMLLKCLDYHGHLIHILYLTIQYEESISCVDKIKLIKSFLERTPNLRTLKIEAALSEDAEPSRIELAEFNIYNSESPWPVLKHLKCLVIANLKDVNREEYASIANAYAHQLHHLHFYVPYVERAEPLRLLSNRFSSLHVIWYNYFDSRGAGELEDFLQASQCPLKHLTVTFETTSMKNISSLTATVNAASSTLKTLDFRQKGLKPRRNYAITKFNQFRLPKLKELALHNFSYPSHQFLRKVCPALQHLHVFPSYPASEGWKLLKSGEMYRDLYSEHQFWNELPDIQSVHVEYMFRTTYVFVVDGKRTKRRIKKKIPGVREEKVYTRRGYETKIKMERAMEMKHQSSKLAVALRHQSKL